MKLSLYSRKLGTTITFTRPGGGYVYADLNGQPGTLGVQICHGGRTTGRTIDCGTEAFERVCRNWLRAYLRNDQA
jgi:hypothetical protein